jgi:alpha-tubulin suppressor-like RCC1 family protein
MSGSNERRSLRTTCAVGVIVAVATTALWGTPAQAHSGRSAGVGVPIVGPTQVGSATDWTGIATGGSQTCAIRAGGTLWCWGAGERTPKRVGAETRWHAISAGRKHTCGIGVGGSLWCWGGNASGQLGDGTTTSRSVPTRVGAAAGWVDVAAGYRHTCAIRTDGSLWCWGDNDSGQLGNGERACTDLELCEGALITTSPARVGDGTSWASVTAGGGTTCAIRTNGSLWCWGDNLYGQAGNGRLDCWDPASWACTGNVEPQLQPGQVGTATDWAGVVAGEWFTCGLRIDATLWCWGDNIARQLGEPTDEQRDNRMSQLTPLQIQPGSRWTSVATGAFHTCAIRAAGTMLCWGANDSGKLGDGTDEERTSPVPVGPGRHWTGVTAAGAHSCARRSNGTVWCWGDTEGERTGHGFFAPPKG